MSHPQNKLFLLRFDEFMAEYYDKVDPYWSTRLVCFTKFYHYDHVCFVHRVVVMLLYFCFFVCHLKVIKIYLEMNAVYINLYNRAGVVCLSVTAYKI